MPLATPATPATHAPETYDDARAWYGPDMAARTDWTFALTPQEVAELDHAVARVIASDIDLVTLTAAQFVLPTLAPKLRQLRQQLLQGSAVALLRGWLFGATRSR